MPYSTEAQETDRTGMTAQETAASNSSAQAFLDALAMICWPYMFEEFLDVEVVQEQMTKADDFAFRIGITRLWERLKRRLTPDMESASEEIEELADSLKSNEVKNERSLSTRDTDFLRSWRVWMMTESPSSHRDLLRFVGLIASPVIAAKFVKEAIDAPGQSEAREAASELVFRMTRRKNSTKLTLAEAKRLRETRPRLYQEYLEVRRQINAVTKQAVINITRANGAPMLVSEVIKKLEASGIEHSLPSSFAGKVDERGYYTIFNEPVEGVPVGKVKMNPAYTEGAMSWVFQYQADGAETWQTIYTKSAKSTRKTEKYAKVASAIDGLEQYQARWRKDLINDKSRNQELAMITEMLFITASRIGTPGNSTAGQPTFGLTTILGQNVEFKGLRARILYKQKKGSMMQYIIEPDEKYSRKVVELLKVYKKRAGKDGLLFEASAREVNEYIKRTVKLPLTSHGFRYMRGTSMMKALLDSHRAKLGHAPTSAEVINAFKESGEKVGEALGHSTRTDEGTKVTGATAVKSYIDPSVSRSWFEEFGMRPPRNIEALG